LEKNLNVVEKKWFSSKALDPNMFIWFLGRFFNSNFWRNRADCNPGSQAKHLISCIVPIIIQAKFGYFNCEPLILI
jgi:hypothetical protein